MRKLMVIALFAAAAAATPALPARAEDAPAAPPATQPAAGDVIDVKDFAKLKDMEGKTATVRGTVSDTYTPASGSILILNFQGLKRRDFNVVVKKANLDAVNAGFNGGVAAAVKGHAITVTGPVSIYRGNPQIEVTKPEQIKVEAASGEKKEGERD